MSKAVESPCIRSCCLDQQDVCVGCFRTLSEILEWGNADDQRRRIILTLSSDRKVQHRAKYTQYK